MDTNRLKVAALLGVAALLVASCASIRRGADRGIVRELESHLAAGRGAELAALSQTPFLLDGEVVVLPEDVHAFWTEVAASGWSLEETVPEGGEPVDEQSYRRFADTQEARAFFRNYVGPGARLITLTEPAGRRVLVLVQEKLFSRKLLGFGVLP